MKRSPAGFEDLCDRVICATASDQDLALFRAMLEKDPALLDDYAWQMRVHSELTLRSSSRPHVLAAAPALPAVRFRKVAAAVAALLGLLATGLWLAAGAWEAQQLQAVAETPVAGRPSPVKILHLWGACGLELPERLPGVLRLQNGKVTARLGSGMELTLLGPLTLQISSHMEARLLSGRLLAEVSKSASGFTLYTPDLEIWDIGTLFGVTVTDEGTDVFVFKGEVQVVESDGEPVDICRTGEGARARHDGSGAVKIAADTPAAAWLLARTLERGVLKDPEDAFYAIQRISDIWAAEWMPKVVTPAKPVPGLMGNMQAANGNQQSAAGSRQSAIANRQSPIASKGAALCPPSTLNNGGVDPAPTIAAIAPQKEEEEMKGTAKTVAAIAATTLMGAGTLRADLPVVSSVNMTQIPNTRMVQVTYNLADTNAIITLSIETNGVAIPDSAVTRLSGDVNKVVGTGNGKSIVWNAGADWPENVTETAKARVTAWSVDAPPQYCAIDVAAGSAASSYPVFYFNSAEAVPGGVTNDIYKTVRILLRKLPATGGEGFMMGSPTTEAFRSPNGERENWHNVILNNTFYIGVYEITQSQWYQVMGTWPSHFNNIDYRLARPVEKVTYNDIRGFSAGAGWPGSDAVDANSFMGRIRSKTVVAGFDLPTDAQWEYACRAGKSSALNDGTLNITNTNSDAQLDLLARYKFNDGWLSNGASAPPQNSSAENGTAIVGSYTPNDWGLYDMHGNVYEWCLDWYTPLLGFTTVTDPVGPSSGEDDKRVLRSGAFDQPAAGCRSAMRTRNTPSIPWESGGFRLARNLP